MIIVPIGKTHADMLFQGAKGSAGGNRWYWYLRSDNECFGVMSDGVADGGYWAYERSYILKKAYWIKRVYHSEYTIDHLDFDEEYGDDTCVWVGGTLKYNIRHTEVSVTRCDWIDTAISALMSGNTSMWSKLLQYFNYSNITPVVNKLGGIVLKQGSKERSLHGIIESKYFTSPDPFYDHLKLLPGAYF